MSGKNWFLFLIACILVVSLAACQPSPAPTSAPSISNTEAPTQGVMAYPYPQPQINSAPTAYPEPQISSEPANWSDVPGLLQKGDVASIIQTRNLNVYLKLKDGRTLKAAEPALDDILNLLNQCGDTCKEITVEFQ